MNYNLVCLVCQKSLNDFKDLANKKHVPINEKYGADTILFHKLQQEKLEFGLCIKDFELQEVFLCSLSDLNSFIRSAIAILGTNFWVVSIQNYNK